MNPYYEDKWVKIFHGDCREILPTLDCKVDLVLTDPPYGYNTYEHDKGVDLNFLFMDNPQTVITFGYPEVIIRWCMQLNRIVDYWLVWWPSNGAAKGGSWGQIQRETEHIAIFGTINSSKLKEPKSDSVDLVSFGKLPDRKPSDVFRDPSPGIAFNSHLRLHPNEKPVSLMKKLVLLLGDGIVIDPFMGSGSTIQAARELNRYSIGIEIEEKHCEIAAKRCSQEVMELAL